MIIPNILEMNLRIILVLGSLLTFFFVIHYIRKSRVRIEDTIFWILLCLVLIVISIFPEIPFYISEILKFESPINMVYLLIIFILIVNQFYLSIKISQLHISQKELVQKIAVEKTEKDKEKKEEGK